MFTRESLWSRLGEQDCDLLVIGGGIVGVGIARDAARRGLKVSVVEAKDLAWGTSSRSSKLVHGGFRYLEQYEFSLVFESVSERRTLMDLAPHLVNPLGFIFPVYRGFRHKLWKINAGMWLYDGLSLFRSPKIHRKLRPKDAAVEEPLLKTENLEGATLYFDCSTDDARLTLETAVDAVANGAVIATYARVTNLVTAEDGRVVGAVARNELTGEEKTLKAHVVINATGPWTDRLLQMSASPPTGDLLRPTKGVHIVVPHAALPLNHSVVCAHPDDGRMLFAIPWGDCTYLGTTDTDFEGDPGDVHATGDDVDYLLRASNAYFPEKTIDRSHVISTWAGVRPLISPEEETEEESKVSREHEVRVGRDGLITIAGGKLTTYRRMAEEVVDTTTRMLELQGKVSEIPHADTAKVPLPGGNGWPEDDDHDHVASLVEDKAQGALDRRTARHLADNYGMRSLDVADLCANRRDLAVPICDGRVEILAQVHFAVTMEMATKVSDVMIRRTQLFYRDHDQGLGGVEAVARVMADILGWDGPRTAQEIEEYQQDVALSRKWKTT
ncbi:MAG: glycerol-3-phosphate dehydrogenase [Myxococcales bacterium]|nr:glycerol-3-phosphate dehydrogenase [Myxococcales bacterium]